MGKNHYEAAFELFLRQWRVPYISNRQEHRNRFVDGTSLKNFDFVVTDSQKQNWIIDVKGRRFPGGLRHGRYWKHWTTHDDLAGLLKWESFLGENFRGLFVFAYLIDTDRSPVPQDELFLWHKRLYAFIGIDLHDYIAEAKLISPRWNTYELPVRRFRSLARPFTQFLTGHYFSVQTTRN
ncbi:MAG: HYExAFE family protein [Planctomycetia bacterium]|nr:HYExAFE family protein [Planctomycetia bacterium]